MGRKGVEGATGMAKGWSSSIHNTRRPQIHSPASATTVKDYTVVSKPDMCLTSADLQLKPQKHTSPHNHPRGPGEVHTSNLTGQLCRAERKKKKTNRDGETEALRNKKTPFHMDSIP